MKDIPMFTTENGVASLFLQDIPYRGIGRIKVLSSQCPEELLQECAEFCRACGAEEIHASGDAVLAKYPHVADILEMRGSADGVGKTDAMLFPVQEETAERWRTIANEKLQKVDNAAYISSKDAKKAAHEGTSYFVHRNGQLLGIGQVGEDSIELVASVAPGGGKEIVAALSQLLPQEDIRLQVASTNHKAIKLYENLGFVVVKTVSSWYKIF